MLILSLSFQDLYDQSLKRSLESPKYPESYRKCFYLISNLPFLRNKQLWFLTSRSRSKPSHLHEKNPLMNVSFSPLQQLFGSPRSPESASHFFCQLTKSLSWVTTGFVSSFEVSNGSFTTLWKNCFEKSICFAPCVKIFADCWHENFSKRFEISRPSNLAFSMNRDSIFFIEVSLDTFAFEIVDSIERICFYSLKPNLEVPKDQKAIRMTQPNNWTFVSS